MTAALQSRRVTAAKPVLTLRNAIEVLATLWADGAVVPIVGTISAAVQDGAGNQLIAPTAQVSGQAGANWPQGVVMVFFPASVNNLIRGDAFIEIQYTPTADGVPRTWPLISAWVQNGVIAP